MLVVLVAALVAGLLAPQPWSGVGSLVGGLIVLFWVMDSFAGGTRGGYVGRTWAGSEDGPYTVVPYFFSDLADWTWFEYVGPAGPDDEATVRGSMDDDDFVVYYSRDGRVTGCLGVNRSDDVEAAKQLIADGAGVPEEQG